MIRMLVAIAGVDFSISPGETTDRFSAEEAARFIAAGMAEAADVAPMERAIDAPAVEKRRR
jgi:hypothetical protein